MSNLSKIKQVDLRKAWNHEAHDFTNWLAEPENLSLLSDEIGIDISLIQTEASVGKFNVDILAEEEHSGRKIIIENQLEITDHDHLGKIITYASGYDAEIVIWIVKDVRDEHKQAIDWLNEHTNEDIYFFAIKMELWQIADSPFAPKFSIISKPNDWSKAIKQSAQGQLSDTKVLQLDFWKSFKEYMTTNNTSLSLRTPRPQHWYDLSIGVHGVHISLTTDTQKNLVACELYIPDWNELFADLVSSKEKIEKEIGHSLDWQPLEGKKASRIKLSRDGDIMNTEQWEEYFYWLKQQAEIFQIVFYKYIRKAKKNI